MSRTGLDIVHSIGMRGTQGLRQLHCARIALGRQLGIPVPPQRAQRFRVLHPRVGGRHDVDGVRHGVALYQRVITGQRGARQIPARGPVERENPIPLIRLQAQGVAIAGPWGCKGGGFNDSGKERRQVRPSKSWSTGPRQ